MKWVIIKGVRYPSSVISAFAAYNMDDPFLKVRIRNKYHIVPFDDVNKMANQMVYLMDNYPDFVQIGRWWISKKTVMSWVPKEQAVDGSGWVISFTLSFGLEGGTQIRFDKENPNTGKIIDYLDESFMHANCGDCKEEVVITDVDRVKKDIDSMFFEFVKKNGKEPEYVECQIVWKDTGDDQRTTIKLSLSINDDDNDNVFYYCNGIESLKSLVEYGVGEFIVIDCWSFFSIDNL